MDISEYTRIVFDRIQKFEPEHATKIIGYLLLQDYGEQELAKLASCPDHFIREVVFKAKTDIQRFAVKPAALSISHTLNTQQGLNYLSVSPRTPTSPLNFQVASPYWDPHSASNTNPDYMAMNCLDSITDFPKHTQLLSSENHVDLVHTGRFSELSEFPFKICHYFIKGHCKHGLNCRYYHVEAPPENFSQIYGNGNDHVNEEVFSPGSLAKLESEIVDLLKQKRGSPMSIASLPMAYYDKYKKVLQADGYLTESQRHGKAGYSLTKLLEKLNSIRLIDRPHGQHAVVLAEDAPKYVQKGDSISASRQIYLTFPAESTFSEKDVSNYFSTFGRVEDVRIPCQQRRMFGFVTFVDPETVKKILDKGNPHYVHDSRVLVKPYREKAKVIERKYQDRFQHSVCYSQHYVDMESELNSIPRSVGNHRYLRRQLIEEQKQALELQRSRLAKLHFAPKPLSNSPPFGSSIDDIRVSDGHFNFQPSESLSSALNDKPQHTDFDFSDENSNEGLNLPDSPFSFPI